MIFENFEEKQTIKIPEIISSGPKPVEYQKEILIPMRTDQKVTEYMELKEYPEFSPVKKPTKADCQGYKFMSMAQLCRISESFGIRGKGKSFACAAFGGDNGEKAVQADRQAWVWKKGGKSPVKFVLIRAVERFFEEEGLDW
ncbi:MAG: hypothetical protein CVU41_18945 [Chloroflexi bacterium HGW-Chloroflexi-3]|nr:MAG: hypothetical protein CVU41_18945 [Chloroflexi bacterium HGW-Chloroflexi-3]